MFGNLRNRQRRSKRQIDLALHEAFEVAGNVPAFQQLVLHVQQHTEMLRTLPAGGLCSWQPAVSFVSGLRSLVAHRRSWRRDVETWVPPAGSAWSQFSSLANHLFGIRPVPAFMTSAWFEGRSPEARRHQKWFKHLALGHDIRGVVTPIPLTKIMGRYFFEAPHHCSVNQAVRWSQVRGLGGDPALAEAIAATRLGEKFDHEEYWSLAIRFLIDNPDLGLGNVEAIVEYLQFHGALYRMRSESKQAKRRFAEDFVERVQSWRAQHSLMKRRPSLTWQRSGIGEFECRDHGRLWNSATWKIRELLDDAQLWEEGRQMRHCVGRYSLRCKRGISTIWSLTCSDTRNQCRRELTIDVNPTTRRIAQAKGVGNSRPTLEARRIMLLWARKEGLGAEPWV